MLKFKVLKADRQSALFRDFRDIFESLAFLHDRFDDAYELSSFDYTEQTAVSAFVWAAATRQRLALAEYQIAKSKSSEKKFKRKGRADLWIDFPDQTYSMEFKVASYQATSDILRRRFDAACRDAGCLDPDEQDCASGVLIAYVKDEKRLKVYEKFAAQPDVLLSVRIGKRKPGSCFIYFGNPIG